MSLFLTPVAGTEPADPRTRGLGASDDDELVAAALNALSPGTVFKGTFHPLFSLQSIQLNFG